MYISLLVPPLPHVLCQRCHGCDDVGVALHVIEGLQHLGAQPGVATHRRLGIHLTSDDGHTREGTHQSRFIKRTAMEGTHWMGVIETTKPTVFSTD